jgi:iron(III) transport system substrate-binding protein
MSASMVLRAALAALVALGAASVAPPVLAQPAPTSGDAAWRYLATLPRDQRLAAVQREAKREGHLTLYGALAIDKANVFLDIFKKQYPDIATDFVRLETPALPDRLLLEDRTGRTNADAAISDQSYMILLKDLLAPYEPASWEDFDAKFREGGQAQGWTAVVWEMLPTTIAWRTDRVSAQQAPKTLDAVMDPKWKGRTGSTAVLERFIDAMLLRYGEASGMDKLRKLAALDNHLYATTAALSEAMAAGEIDVAWNFNAQRPVLLKKQGAPVEFVFQDPLFGSGDTISAMRKAPHPYAAALFMEFMCDAQVMEATEKIEGGRLFGNEKGKFEYKLADFPTLQPFRAMSRERFTELNAIANTEFLRRR